MLQRFFGIGRRVVDAGAEEFFSDLFDRNLAPIQQRLNEVDQRLETVERDVKETQELLNREIQKAREVAVENRGQLKVLVELLRSKVA